MSTPNKDQSVQFPNGIADTNIGLTKRIISGEFKEEKNLDTRPASESGKRICDIYPSIHRSLEDPSEAYLERSGVVGYLKLSNPNYGSPAWVKKVRSRFRDAKDALTFLPDRATA